MYLHLPIDLLKLSANITSWDAIKDLDITQGLPASVGSPGPKDTSLNVEWNDSSSWRSLKKTFLAGFSPP